MRVLMSGGTGLIGTHLSESLVAEKHQVWVLTRHPQTAHLPRGVQAVGWDGQTTIGWGELVSQVDAIVNLAGENIGAGPWSRSRKTRIVTSRVQAGKTLTEAIRVASPRPSVFIQASAVGYYGPRGSEPVTEDTGPGTGFLTEICQLWEASSQPVEELGLRRVIIRTGVVLSVTEGALVRLVLPFKLFIGGPLGNGRQGFPWIHPEDETAAIRFLIDNEKAHGVFNLSAPNPLSYADFGRILGRVLHRPFWLPIPAILLRLVLGEMSTLVLDGQFLLPKRLSELGFHFKYEYAADALQDLFQVENT